MSRNPILLCICFLIWTQPLFATRFQGPAGEVVIKRPPPPPVDERAVARAQHALHQRMN